GSSDTEQVPAGSEAVLGPGDTRISRNETAFEAANDGTTPVELLLGFMIADTTYREPVPTGWVIPPGTWESVDFNSSKRFLAPAELVDYQLRLRKLTLGPHATSELPPGSYAQIGITLDPKAPIGRPSDGTLRNLGDDTVTVHALTLEPRTPRAELTAP
ncbi:MAG: hypothetical protein KC442_13430, partial [Thermomicrobiales bacterium]|nr:hypothetical protein [Thermomicrobiales bacterium]